jgi:tetratricopeptide (TPR) repeat protein
MKIFFSISILLFSIYSTSQTLEEKVEELNELITNQDYEVALNKCNKLISEEKSYPELYLLKAQCLMEGRRIFIKNENLYQETIRTLDKAISIDSNYNYPYGRKGLLNIINRRFDLAISDYTKFIS